MLLSSLSALPDNDVLTHMYHLKISINDIRAADENIVHLLKETPFILVSGQRYRARDFYRQQEPVFEAMLPRIVFHLNHSAHEIGKVS
ncbi:hypothetical protein BaRGS_00012652 [Batillaria attramentaria]|uniref:Uncharacterized protein n=1 Tax=Batillaria attramentaria TaxID=370345 RepID=A0ABD0L9I5_9CAEN